MRLLDPFDVQHRVALLSDLQNRRESSWAMSLRYEGTSRDSAAFLKKSDWKW